MNAGKSKVMSCSRYGNERQNACDTKQRTVRGSGLFQVPGGRKWQPMEDVKGMWYKE